jgi:hypothetical protein
VWDNKDYPYEGFSVRCIQDIATGGINDVNNRNWLIIYPNPSKDYLTIENIQHAAAVIEISNMQGKFITSLAINADKTNIDVSALTAGVYMVKLKAGNEVMVKKFIKE